MKIGRYLGKDVQEALLKLKMDFGNDAVILNTRKVKRKGWLRFFKKPMIEVLGAIDEDYGTKKNVVRKEPKLTGVNIQSAIANNDGQLLELEKKVSDMESVLNKIYQEMQKNDIKVSEKSGAGYENSENSKILQLFSDNLIKNGVEAKIVDELIGKVRLKHADCSVNEVANSIFEEIGCMIKEPEELIIEGKDKSKVVMFVGPTGVGKTTTVAKIAADFAINKSMQVGLITADTYRIAAIEQLKTYAEILGIPLTVVYTPNDIEQALRNYEDKDLILIDTAGRSHRNKVQFDELKAFITVAKADEVYLLLSVATNERVCKDILKNYAFLEDYKLIFTKMDESPVCGVILNTVKHTGKKLSYVTNGQNVPDDIEMADVSKITKSLLGRMLE